MQDTIIYIDPKQAMNLQNQIRQKLVDGILNGSFAPGMKLPSSRKRSGIFVDESIFDSSGIASSANICDEIPVSDA